MTLPTLESGITPFEVRCPRCDVTFPIGTKRCVHCGGRTVRSGAPRALGKIETIRRSEGDGSSGSISIEGSAESSVDLPDYEESDRELEIEDEPPSIARTLVRSLGGLIWVIALIAFSLARNCGDK